MLWKGLRYSWEGHRHITLATYHFLSLLERLKYDNIFPKIWSPNWSQSQWCVIETPHVRSQGKKCLPGWCFFSLLKVDYQGNLHQFPAEWHFPTQRKILCWQKIFFRISSNCGSFSYFLCTKYIPWSDEIFRDASSAISCLLSRYKCNLH